MSLMTTMTQLFKIVTTNNHETLDKIIHSNTKTNFNCVKSRQSLLQKAVEVRAKECFDLLIEIPNIDIIKKGGTLSGLQKALEYYLDAPNQGNRYFVDKLLDANVFIDITSLISSIDHDDIFSLMFDKVEKTEGVMMAIIQTSIGKNNNRIMKSMFDILDKSNDFSFYNDPTKKAIFNNKVFINTFNNSTNVDAFNFLINRGCNWKIHYSNSALLYYLMNSNNTYLFNVIYSLYAGLDSEELNQIPYIKSLVIDPRSNDSTYFIEFIDKIGKLPIEFNDCASEVIKILKRIITDQYYWETHNKKMKHFDQLILILNKMYKFKMIKSNPFYTVSTINIGPSEIENFYLRIIKRYDIFKLNDIKQTIRQFLYVCSYYGHDLKGLLIEKFNGFFMPEQLNSFDVDKKAFVELINQDITKVKVTKATRKNKPNVNIDIEV